MAIVTTKQLIALGAIVLATNGATAVLITRNNSSGQPTTTKSRDASSTVSATTILKHPSEYANMDILVQGSIIKSADSYFIVGNEKKTPGAIKLDFSKTKLDPKNYVASSDAQQDQTPKPADPTLPAPAAPAAPTPNKNQVPTGKNGYTVRGRLAQPDPSRPQVLVVESIK